MHGQTAFFLDSLPGRDELKIPGGGQGDQQIVADHVAREPMRSAHIERAFEQFDCLFGLPALQCDYAAIDFLFNEYESLPLVFRDG